MKQKRIVPRVLARRDVEKAIDHYTKQAGIDVVDRFVAALRSAYQSIAIHPKLGSPFFGYDLNIPGLRSRRLTGYPYIVFYVEKEDTIDIWRVLHTRRDIANLMKEETI